MSDWSSVIPEVQKLSDAEALKFFAGLSDAERAEFDAALAQQKAPAKPGDAEVAGRAALQGATFGLSDEAGGAVQAGLQGLANLMPKGSLEWAGISNDYKQPASEAYVAGRDESRRANAAAEAANPELYSGVELGTGVLSSMVPVGTVAKGAGLLAKGAQAVSKATPALTGALNAFGHAEGTAGEQALQTAGGAVLGKYIDKGLKGVGNKLKGARKFVDGKKFESLAQWFRRLGGDADEAILATAEKSKEKAVKSAAGSMGSEAADIIRSRDVAKQAAEELASVNPELAAKLREAADSPEALARLQGAAENYLPRITEGLEKFAEKGTELAAAKARDPAAEAAQRGVKDVFLSDKSKKWYGGEAIRKGAPLAGYMLGDALGGEEDAGAKTFGAGAGLVASLMTGGRGSKVVNDLRSPEVQRALAKGGKWTAEKLGGFADSLARPAILEATDDVDEKYRALAEWLGARRGQ